MKKKDKWEVLWTDIPSAPESEIQDKEKKYENKPVALEKPKLWKPYLSDILVMDVGVGTFVTSRTRLNEKIVSEVTCFCDSVHPPVVVFKNNPWVRLCMEEFENQKIVTEVFEFHKGVIMRKLVFHLKKESEEITLMKPVIESLSFALCLHIGTDIDQSKYLFA